MPGRLHLCAENLDKRKVFRYNGQGSSFLIGRLPGETEKEWSRVLLELRRVAETDGVIHLAGADLPDQSSSPALLRLFRLLARAYGQAGRYVRAQANGVASDLAGLLRQQQLRTGQTRICRPEITGDTDAGRLFYENVRHLFRTNIPFLQKWTRLPDDYEDLYQQMLLEVQQRGFVVSNLMIVARGSNP